MMVTFMQTDTEQPTPDDPRKKKLFLDFKYICLVKL